MVFATAFVAGAVAAVGINRALDVHLAQAKPKVECEPIFVALRSLPQGTPVTIWDVALRDWPKAMLPSSALRAHDQFEGMILRHPVREGQPLLAVQLAQAEAAPSSTPAPMAVPIAQPISQLAQGAVPAPQQSPAVQSPPAAVEADLWAPAAEAVVTAPAVTPAPAPTATVAAPTEPAKPGEPTMAEPLASDDAQPASAPAEAVSVVTGPPAAAPTAAAPVTAPAAPAQPVVRYLVVPERIAMQADNSFVAPAKTQALAAAAASEMPPAVRKPESPAATTSVPPVAQHPGNRRTKPGQSPAKNAADAAKTRTATSTPSTPSRPSATTGGHQPQPSSRTGQSESADQAATKRSGGMFGSMFPNLRAGIDAVEAELDSIRRGRTEDDTAPATPRKTSPHPPSQRAAGWPKMGSTPPQSF